MAEGVDYSAVPIAELASIPLTRRCCRCRERKPLAEFHVSKRKKHGRVYRCNKCANEATLQSRRKLSLGLTHEQYVEMVMLQCGNCAICSEPEKYRNRSLSVDHDHATGRIRGLLCGSCNMGIGLLAENERRFVRAVSYLREGSA